MESSGSEREKKGKFLESMRRYRIYRAGQPSVWM